MTDKTNWKPAPALLNLRDDEIHVWRASLDMSPEKLCELATTLDPEEVEKASRFNCEKAKRHYRAGRGILRVLLGRYLNVEPHRVPITYNLFGKPELAMPGAGPLVRFNLAHSHGLALYAFTRGRNLGIDLERIRSEVSAVQIADRFFSPEEARALRAIPVAARPLAFFRCWTRKEAITKAHGKGLFIPLNQVVVSLAPEPASGLVTTAFQPYGANRWWSRDLDPGTGFLGALAAEVGDWKLQCWHWDDGTHSK